MVPVVMLSEVPYQDFFLLGVTGGLAYLARKHNLHFLTWGLMGLSASFLFGAIATLTLPGGDGSLNPFNVLLLGATWATRGAGIALVVFEAVRVLRRHPEWIPKRLKRRRFQKSVEAPEKARARAAAERAT